jgi:protein-L-isoaspartate O-methyltransferase
VTPRRELIKAVARHQSYSDSDLELSSQSVILISDPNSKSAMVLTSSAHLLAVLAALLALAAAERVAFEPCAGKKIVLFFSFRVQKSLEISSK